MKPCQFLKDRIHDCRGMSLIETLIAAAISLVVLGGATSFIYYFFTQNSLFEQWSGSHQDSFLSLEQLQNDLRNVISLSPYEDLAVLNDSKYFGVATLDAAQKPTYCSLTPNFNVIVATTLSRKKRPEKILRVWDEIASSGQVGSANEIRITADSSVDSLFSATSGPREITIIDADRRYTRRYRVVSYVMHLGTNVDPSDDVNRAPQTFDYVSVFVDNPVTSTGVVNPRRLAVFITSSEVFESDTSVYCFNPSVQALQKVSLSSAVTEESFRSHSKDFDVSAAKFEFAKTSQSTRVEATSFYPDIFDLAIDNCVNVLKLTIELSPTATRIDKAKIQSSGEVSKRMIRSRMLFLPNLNYRRPVSCSI